MNKMFNRIYKSKIKIPMACYNRDYKMNLICYQRFKFYFFSKIYFYSYRFALNIFPKKDLCGIYYHREELIRFLLKWCNRNTKSDWRLQYVDETLTPHDAIVEFADKTDAAKFKLVFYIIIKEFDIKNDSLFNW